jgi:hypothetical protein
MYAWSRQVDLPAPTTGSEATMRSRIISYGAAASLLAASASMSAGARGSSETAAVPLGVRVEKEGKVKASADERTQVAQRVIDLEALQPYFHADDAPDRKPLRVLKNAQMEDSPPLMKFGEPVQFVSEAGDKPCFEFTTVKIDGDMATVAFRYPVEGIAGSATLRKVGSSWRVESHSLKEK